MKRITARNEYGDYYFVEGENVCPNELAKYIGEREDLERELGLDLITLFKALKNRVYVSNDEYNKSSCLVGLSYGFNHERKKWSLLGFAYGYEAEEWLSLKDYGKTWALTKEELEKGEV